MNTHDKFSGLVRLATSYVLADGFLVDRLGELRERHPGLDIELISDARLGSLARREAEIALRLEPSRDKDIMSRRLARIAFDLYASQAYLDKLAAGHVPAFIGYDRDSDFVFEASWLARQFPTGRVAFRANSQISQAAAARAGYGLALLPRFLAANDPGLVQISVTEFMPTRDVWLLIRSDMVDIPAIKAAAEYLAGLFQREQQFLAAP